MTMRFHEWLQPIPRSAVFAMEGWHVWCGSMVEGDDGLYHLYFSRWPVASGPNGWATHSEVGWATSADPLGPYRYQGVALTGAGDGLWDADVVHNPTVLRIGRTYYMYYMGNRGDGSFWNHRNNQRVGVAYSDRPSGPWTRLPDPVIDVSPGSFDHLMTSNPTAAVRPDGKVVLMYKSVSEGPLPAGGRVACGVALSNHPLGPFVKQPGPVMANPQHDWSVEDPYIWRQDGRFFALAKDFQGYFTGMGKNTIALFRSTEGVEWEPAEHPFALDRTLQWEDGELQTADRLERPQLWLRDGKPAVLFCAVAEDPEWSRSYNVHIPLKPL